MDRLFQNSSGDKSDHPPREMLLLFVDGELASKDEAQLEAHLEACWPCRVKTKKIQEIIADIIEFEDHVVTPRIVPPKGWQSFDRELSKLAEASGKQSFSTRLFDSLNRFLQSSHPFSLPQPLAPPIVRTAFALLMVTLILGLVIYLKHEPTVSASELLRNAIDAQSRQMQSIAQAVVHEKLRVRTQSQTAAGEESASWEIWNDTKNSRVRQFIAHGNQLIPIASSINSVKGEESEVSARAIVNELTRVLETNHMDPQRPLSAASYQSWHNTLHNQQDRVTRLGLADGNEELTLRTVPASPVSVGDIAEAVLVVRAKDWQPKELRLTVATEVGNRTYELTLMLSEVVTLAQINSTVFADQRMSSSWPVVNPGEISNSPPTPKFAPDVQPLPPAVATADLEVEVLQLLHDTQADLGEQVTVSRGADGFLHVTGIIDTSERKAEILRSLQSLANHPAVRIEIQTVAEAVAKQQQQRVRSKATSVPVTEQQVEINSEAIAAAPELRRHFQSDEQVREFAARMVDQSRSATRHVYAMKRLLAQFSPEELRTLTPEAKNKWLGLIRSHANAYKNEAEGIRNQLRVIFPNSSGVPTETIAEIADDTALIRAINRLSELALSNDSVIRSAFALSSAARTKSEIGSAQFWQSMKIAEALAARIQTAH